MKKLTEEKLAEIRVESEEQCKKTMKKFQRQIELVNRISNTWSQTMGFTERRNSNRKGGYHFIPKSSELAIRDIMKAKYFLMAQGVKVEEMRFLDAGCGFGNIMYYAYLCGIRSCSGIDFTCINMEFGINFFRNFCHDLKIPTRHTPALFNLIKREYTTHYSDPIESSFNFIEGNLLEYEDYSPYNIVYFYCPLRMAEGQYLFVQKLADNVAKGTVIIGDGQIDTLDSDKRFWRVPRLTIMQKMHTQDKSSLSFKKHRKNRIETCQRVFAQQLAKIK